MKIIHDFFKSSYFLLLLFVISLVCWITYKEDIGLCIFTGFAAIILLINGPTECLLSLIFNVCFMSRSYISLEKIPISYFISGTVLIVSMVIYLIRNKVNIKKPQM